MSTLLIPKPSATVDVAGHEISVRTGSTVTLDETREYVTATLELPLIDPADVEDIDPRDGVRALITAALGAGDPLIVDLGVRERTVDHRAKTIQLLCASDEAMLADYAPLADDLTPRTHESSLRDVIDYVLSVAIPGHALEATPADDADVTAYWELTNLVPNSNGDSGSTTGWTATTGAPALTVQTSPAPPFPTASGRIIRAQAMSTTSQAVAQTARVPAREGETYTASVYLNSHPTNPRSAYVLIRWLDPTGNRIADTAGAASVTTSGWTRYKVTGVAPPGTAAMHMHIVWGGTHVVGNLHYWWGAMLHAGDETVAPFTGATADDSHYFYDWTDAPNESSSTRTPVLERLPESLTWKAGQSAWEFLLSLTAPAGLRLRHQARARLSRGVATTAREPW